MLQAMPENLPPAGQEEVHRLAFAHLHLRKETYCKCSQPWWLTEALSSDECAASGGLAAAAQTRQEAVWLLRGAAVPRVPSGLQLRSHLQASVSSHYLLSSFASPLTAMLFSHTPGNSYFNEVK